MELVYLWVEGYKNIEKQGFNFSPKFECEFKAEYEKYTDENGEEKEKLKDNCELVIEPKKHLENFFGENINITAIVGENGSGKTTILNLLTKNPSFIRISVYLDNTKLILSYISLDKNIINYLNYGKNYLNEIKDNNKIINDYYNLNFSVVESKKINKSFEIQLIVDLLKNNNVQIPFKIPQYLYLSYNEIDDELNRVLKDQIKENEIFKNLNFNNLFNIDYTSQQDNLILIEFYLFIATLYNDDYNSSCANALLLPKKEPKSLKDFISLFKDNMKGKKELQLINNILTHIKSNFKFDKKKSIFEIKINNLSIDFISNYLELINQGQKNNSIFDFEFDISLSAGEYTFLVIFAQVFKFRNKNNNFLLIDEGELSLHPRWQKKYLSNLIEFLKNNYQNKNTHLILTSHSPFILSDLPKENVIFLEKDKETASCKNVTKNMTISPFGANIHTLLSHGFFMKDGLMGEFAKNKIRTITVAHKYIIHKHKKQYLEKQSYQKTKDLIIKNLSKFWEIQKITGEPFLQTIIKNQIQELELILLNKEDAIDNEIQRLEGLKKSLLR